jgi:F0F1-type ATP synthase epsilon subunit
MDTSTNKEVLNLIIRQKDRILFKGEVKAFSSFSDRGAFDILQNHANFISIIKDHYIIHKLDGTKNEKKIDEGIVRVHENIVTVYLGILG